jgi:beta-1,4-N-acetylglucosaminyltransferase
MQATYPGRRNSAHTSIVTGRRPCLLVASNGGHLLQLVQFRDLWPREERHWVTFDKPDSRSLLAGEDVTWAYYPTNRNIKNLLLNIVLAVRVVTRLRPRAVVSTGAGVAVPFCYVGRLFGARVIFIESFSRVTAPSLTARLVHPVAHRFFVQWPALRDRFRKAEYEGTVF